MMSEKITCPTCRGEKVYTEGNMITPKRCPRCDGKGTVEAASAAKVGE